MLAPATRLLGGGEVREFPPVDEAGLQQHVVLEGREEVATGGRKCLEIGPKRPKGLRNCWASLGRF